MLITGGTAGIGFATARDLVGRGARVLITGLDANRGNEAAAVLASDRADAPVTFLQADHATVGGNQRLAGDVAAHTAGLDVLVNNVGGLSDTRRETADGYEWTLAMNFVGPYALTMQLLPLLRAGAPSRCVNVVSAAFKLWKRDPFDDVQATRRFVGGDGYAHTKLLSTHHASRRSAAVIGRERGLSKLVLRRVKLADVAPQTRRCGVDAASANPRTENRDADR